MATSHTIPRLTRAIGGRAVHLRLLPRPESMAESREILRLLQGYGKVEMFKNLKYDAIPTPNTMLAIFQSEEAAVQLLRRSPLRFNMSRDQVEEDSVEENYGQPAQPAVDSSQSMSSDRLALAETAAATARQTSTTPRPTSTSSSSSSSTAPAREYELQVNIATVHHRDQINANAYHGPFAIDTKSAMQEDLAKRVPILGLSDVNLKKSGKPWKVLVKEMERESQRHKTLRHIMQVGNKQIHREPDVDS